MDYEVTTWHGLQRAKKRMGLNERKAESYISNAISRGKGADDFSSWEKNYLLNESNGTTKAVAYNNFCFILGAENVCVTMFPLPNWFGKKKAFDGKEKIRNRKKYSAFHTEEAAVM